MTVLTSTEQSKIRFYFQQVSPLYLNEIYYGDALTTDYDAALYALIQSAIAVVDSAYTELNTPTLVTFAEEPVTQDITVVSDLTSSTTTYGDRTKTTKRIRSVAARTSIFHSSVERLAAILGVDLYC